MTLKKWSQAEIIFAPTSTTKICIIDGADPENKVISVEDLMTYFGNNYELTKEEIEAVLTGNITSHTHNYLTGISKAMVEAVLTGTITSHTHDVSSITGAVSTSTLQTHAKNNTHLTSDQLTFLNNLMLGNGLTQEQIDILNLFSMSGDDLVVSTNLIIEGSISAFGIGNDSILNYDMLTNWGDYNVSMTDWVVAAPLLYDLYQSNINILSVLDTKIDTIEVVYGDGLFASVTDNEISISLDIENLTIETIASTDYIPFWRSSGNQYRGLLSDFPYVISTRNVYTPIYSNPSSTTGGGLTGGGELSSDLYLELAINTLDLYSGTPDNTNDYLVVYDNSTSLHKKLALGNLPATSSAVWGSITGTITNQTDLVNLINANIPLSSITIIAGTGLSGGGLLTEDRTIALNIGSLSNETIELTDYIPFWRTGGNQYRADLSDLVSLLSEYQGWNFQSLNSSDVEIGTFLITSGSTATLKEGSNITLTQANGIITISASTTGNTYSSGTGINIDGITINHANSVSAQAVQGLYSITIDTEGHIDSYGTIVDSLKNPNSLILKFDTGTTEGTDLYTYDGSSTKTIDIKGSNGVAISKSSGIIEFSHSDTSSAANVISVANTFISAITLDTYGHITARSTDTIDFNVSSNYAFSTISIATDSGYTWGTVNVSTSQVADSSSDTLTFVSGTKIDLYTNTVAATDAIKISHQTTNRTNNTSTVSPAFGGTFTAIDSITSDSTGHITAVNTKTVTVPSSQWQTLSSAIAPATISDVVRVGSVNSMGTEKLQVSGGIVINDTEPILRFNDSSVSSVYGQQYRIRQNDTIFSIEGMTNVGTWTQLLISNSTSDLEAIVPITLDTFIDFRYVSEPVAPSTNIGRLYVAPTGKIYLKNNSTTYDLTASGTVTSIAAGNGMNFTTITGTGSVTLGTPTQITSISTDTVTTNSHSHSLNNTGVTASTYTYATITVDVKGRITSASSGSAPVTTYLGLSDTPGSFTANYFVKVNSAGTALEHVAQNTIGLSGFNNNANFITASSVNFTNLNNNGSVGTGVSQVAAGNHTHSYDNYQYWDLCVNNAIKQRVNSTTFVNFKNSTNVTVGYFDTTPDTGDYIYFDLSNTGVSANTYTNATITVDSKGRITSASSGSGSGYWVESGGIVSLATESNKVRIGSALSSPYTQSFLVNGSSVIEYAGSLSTALIIKHLSTSGTKRTLALYNNSTTPESYDLSMLGTGALEFLSRSSDPETSAGQSALYVKNNIPHYRAYSNGTVHNLLTGTSASGQFLVNNSGAMVGSAGMYYNATYATLQIEGANYNSGNLSGSYEAMTVGHNFDSNSYSRSIFVGYNASGYSDDAIYYNTEAAFGATGTGISKAWTLGKGAGVSASVLDFTLTIPESCIFSCIVVMQVYNVTDSKYTNCVYNFYANNGTAFTVNSSLISRIGDTEENTVVLSASGSGTTLTFSTSNVTVADSYKVSYQMSGTFIQYL